MSTPELSDLTTDGVRVGATGYYLPDESEPDDRRFVFGYTIVIVNTGDEPVQLLTRHWVIIDALGRREEVQGDGVVGQQPRLMPGKAFKYQSFCPLKTPWGTMEGSYRLRTDSGEEFDAHIGRFFLTQPVRENAESSR